MSGPSEGGETSSLEDGLMMSGTDQLLRHPASIDSHVGCSELPQLFVNTNTSRSRPTEASNPLPDRGVSTTRRLSFADKTRPRLPPNKTRLLPFSSANPKPEIVTS
eukprot:1587284-Rhodomonas_salina.1